MDLKTYLNGLTAEDRATFATACETTPGHMRNVMYGQKSCATDLAVRIERHSGRQVRRWELRGDWFEHWPELIGTEGAPPVPADRSATKQAA